MHMKDLSFIAPNKKLWQRIEKRNARKAYDIGQNIYVCSQSEIKDLPLYDTGNHKPDDADIYNKNICHLSFDDIYKKMSQQTPTQIFYFADYISIPSFYNVADNLELQCPDGQTRQGSLFYLCDTPTDDIIKHGHENGVSFPTAVSQYAPEIRKPTMFIPYGAIAYFE